MLIARSQPHVEHPKQIITTIDTSAIAPACKFSDENDHEGHCPHQGKMEPAAENAARFAQAVYKRLTALPS